jgi:hypothetical protein
MAIIYFLGVVILLVWIIRSANKYTEAGSARDKKEMRDAARRHESNKGDKL